LNTVTVVPITTAARGLSTEVALGEENGLASPCVASCDNVTTIPRAALGEQIGVLLRRQEPALGEAIRAAFDLG
jgi:mRNA interferase MazF